MTGGCAWAASKSIRTARSARAGAWLKHDYLDAPGQRGLGFLTDAQLRAQMEEVAAAGMQVAVHAIGDAANEQLLSAIEALSPRFTGDRRWRVEHAQVVDRPISALRPQRHHRLDAAGPPDQRHAHGGSAHGPAAPGGAYAWKSMLEAGSRLAFGSDYPVESPNPFHGLAVAVSRQDAQGRPPRGWLAKEKLTMEQALAAFTSEAAYAGFAEDRIGRLAPGMAADFILIDRDIVRERDQRRVRGTQVLETWVGGERVWAREAAAR
jgi:predicted amidohydrolase YtcJ